MLLRKLFLSKIEKEIIVLHFTHQLIWFINLYTKNEHLHLQRPDYVKDKSFQFIYKEMKKFL